MYHFISQLRKTWHNPLLLRNILELLPLLEAIIHKLINLGAPHCKVKVLGAIQDAWPSTNPYDVKPMRSYFSNIWFVAIPLNNICVLQLFKISGGASLLLRLKTNRKKFGKPVWIFDKNQRPSYAKPHKICKPKWTMWSNPILSSPIQILLMPH